jgi:hypothetical protein
LLIIFLLYHFFIFISLKINRKQLDSKTIIFRKIPKNLLKRRQKRLKESNGCDTAASLSLHSSFEEKAEM